SVGEILTFTITVSNMGPNDASGISVRDVVPNGYELISNISHGGSLNNGNVITWSGLSIPNGNTLNLTFQAKLKPAGTGVAYLNTASIVQATQYDPVLSNNSDSAEASSVSTSLITNPMNRQRMR